MKQLTILSFMAAVLFNHISAGTSEGAGVGRYHLNKVADRYYLVNPEGQPFFTLGINHINAVQEPANPNIFSEKYQNDWIQYTAEVVTQLKGWYYNTAGYGSPEAIYPHMPYMEDVFLERNSNFLPDKEFFYPDVFDPKIQAAKLEKLRWMCRNTDNLNLIGYYWTDTPQWDLERSLRTRGTNWVHAIRDLPADAPGRIRYEEYLQECAQAGTEATDEGFLALIAQAHYKCIGEATRSLHPGALIFGERYLMDDHPEVVLEAAMPYIDVLSIQPGSDRFEGAYFDALYEKYKKPIVICDHQCSFPTPQYDKTMWKQLESEQAVAEMYQRYLAEASAKPYIIGYHRCQYIDRFNEHPGVLKQGMLREDGTAYAILQAAVIEANRTALHHFSNQTKP